MNYIISYNRNSHSANNIRASLRARSVTLNRLSTTDDLLNIRGNPANSTILNFGKIFQPENYFMPDTEPLIINHPTAVANVSNKLRFFNQVRDFFGAHHYTDYVPLYFTNPLEVHSILSSTTHPTIVARQSLNGHSGAGIVLLEGEDQHSFTAPLYTVYIPKLHEFRVHIMDGEVIDMQKKSIIANVDRSEINWKIRSFNNGFIFTRDNLNNISERILNNAKQKALDVWSAFNLHYGAVDVIYSSQTRQNYVLEINSAPGLVGTTLDRYVRNFHERYFSH